MHAWLYRTPIKVQFLLQKKDIDAVENFIEEYTDAVRKYHESQDDSSIQCGKCRKITKRFEAQSQAAKDYLFAMDIEDEENVYLFGVIEQPNVY